MAAANAASSSSEEPNLEPLDVRVTLARPFYRVGSTLVATLVVRRSTETESSATTLSSPSNGIRDALLSLQWRLAGYCRLDPRWHKQTDVAFYQEQQPAQESSDSFQPPLQYKSCFEVWSTEPTELLEVPERSRGRWQDVRPQPIRLVPGQRQSSTDTATTLPLEEQQLAFTLQCRLKNNAGITPTFHATSCRYYTLLQARIQPHDESSNGRGVQWLQVPVTIVAAGPLEAEEDAAATTTTPSITTQSMAHSSGLPCHVTATELQGLDLQHDGPLTSHCHGAAAWYRHLQRHARGHLQSLRVADETGKPVCVLTVVGAGNLSPGSRFLLKFDFPTPQVHHEIDNDEQGNDDNDDWTPCFQVSACLQAEEVVIRRNDPMQRAQYRVLAVASEQMDPLTTERTHLQLTLPLDTPCTVTTPVVEISVACLVDLTVGIVDADGVVTGYRNLRLELPCPVRHGTAAFEVPEPTDDDRALSLSQQHRFHEDDNETAGSLNDPHNFAVHDISDQLKILSLCMAEECGLRPHKNQSSLEATAAPDVNGHS